MAPGVRRFALTAHIAGSVGWLGAVAAFFILSIAGLTSRNPDTVRSAYVAMNLLGQFIIVPLSFAAVLTGLIQALGTSWGLFRYYWVVMKLALTIVATALLLLHQFTAVASAAQRASATPPGMLPNLGGLGTQLVVDAGLAILVLLVNTTLSVFKPWERTPYGQRSEVLATGGAEIRPPPMPLGLKIILTIVGLIVAAIAVVHLAGGGLHHHG
jgi:hypothetical protein